MAPLVPSKEMQFHKAAIHGASALNLELSPWGPPYVRRLRLYKLRFAQAWEPPFAASPFPRAQPPGQHEVAETRLLEMGPSFGRGKRQPAWGCGKMADDARV